MNRPLVLLASLMTLGSLLAAAPVYHSVDYLDAGYDIDNPTAGPLLTAETQLVFPGANLTTPVTKPYVLFGAMVGGSVRANGGEVAGFYPVRNPTSGQASKAAVSFIFYDPADAGKRTKAVVAEFFQEEEGVSVRWLGSRYTDSPKQNYETSYVDYGGADGSVRLWGSSLGSEPGQLAASPTDPGLTLAGLAAAPFVTKANRLMFANPEGEPVLTIDDIKDYAFSARTGGASVTVRNSLALCRERYFNGDNLIVVLNFQDDTYVKGLVVKLTNGEGGVWAQAVKAFYKSNGKLEEPYWDNAASGLRAGVNSSTIAEVISDQSYGIYDLTAVAPKEAHGLILDRSRDWSDLAADLKLTSRDAALTVTVTGSEPTLTFDAPLDVADLRFVSAEASLTTTVTLAVAPGVAVRADALAAGAGISLRQVAGAIACDSFDLAEGSKAYLRGDGTVAAKITGSGGVEIEAGTVGLSSHLSSYSGGTIVRAGGIAKTLASCFTTGVRTGPFGISTMDNTVSLLTGAKLDVAGHGELNYYYYINEDGQVFNSGAPVPDGLSGALALNLRADVTFDSPFYSLKPFDISRMSGRLSFNGHTATKIGDYEMSLTGSSSCYVYGTGTLRIAEGTLSVRDSYVNSADGANVTVVLDPGTEMDCTKSFKISSLTNNGTIHAAVPLTEKGEITTNDFDILRGVRGSGVFEKRGPCLLRFRVAAGSRVDYRLLEGPLALYSQNNSTFSYALNTPGEPLVNHCVTVTPGTVFDVLGVADSLLQVRLSGTGPAGAGALVNTGRFITYSSAQLAQLTLDADATIGGLNGFGLVGKDYGRTRIDLGTRTLTFDFEDSATNKVFWLTNTDVMGTGTLQVADATLALNPNADAGGQNPLVDASEARLEIAAGSALDLSDLGSNVLRVKDFRSDGSCTGNGTLEVLGTLEVGSGALTKVRLANGATIKPGATAAPLVATQLTVGDSVVFDLANVALARDDRIWHALIDATTVIGPAEYTAVNVPEGHRFRVLNGQPSVKRAHSLVVFLR